MGRPLQDREHISGRNIDHDRYYMRRSTWPTRSKAAYAQITSAWEMGWSGTLPQLRRRVKFHAVGLIRVSVRGAGVDGWPLEYRVEVPRTFPGAEQYWRVTVDV